MAGEPGGVHSVRCGVQDCEGNRPDDKSVYYFAGIDEARFKRPVIPGDQLLLEVTIERFVRGVWKFAAQARVGDALAAEAKLMCTVRQL